MNLSPYFHRDPADSFYTDRDDYPACPICDRPLDALGNGKAICPDCNIVYDSPDEIARIAADLAAAPFYGN